MKKPSEDETLEFILFTLGERTLAVETRYLQEVMEPVATTPLPFVPAYVDGLINVSGHIIPQINAASLVLGDDGASSAVETLLVLQISQMPLALRINQVLEPVSIETSAIKPVRKNNKKQSTKNINADYLNGIFVHNQQEVWQLDVNKLKDIVAARKKVAGKPGFLGEVRKTEEQRELMHDFLVINMAGKDYAFALEDIVEIVDLESLNAQPRSPGIVAGISLIRSEPRLILNLALLLGHSADAGIGETVVIVDCNGAMCGLLIDQLCGLEAIAERHIKLSRDKKSRTLLRGDEQVLTPVISPAQLLKGDTLEQIRPYLPLGKQSGGRVTIPTVEFLRFAVNGDLYAFAIDDIQRVVTDKHIEPLLSPHAYILGTTDIEGRVVPVIDLVAQLGYQQGQGQLQEYILVSDGQDEWALAIGFSERMTAIEENCIDAVSDSDSRYVAAFANDRDQLLTVLNVKAICRDNKQRQAG